MAKWHKVVDESTLSGYRDISYELRQPDGTVVAHIYKGGVAGYPWSWSIKGGRSSSSSTLGVAKQAIALELA